MSPVKRETALSQQTLSLTTEKRMLKHSKCQKNLGTCVCVSVCVHMCVFQDRISLCRPGCLGTHSVDQAGLELGDLPASASQVLGLKACTITPG